MNSVIKSGWFKYLKNFIIGFGATLVMLGALGKINSEPWGGTAITIGLLTEAFIFLILGLLPPEKDYYWEKLYPGLDKYNAKISPLTEGEVGDEFRPLNGEHIEGQLGGMLTELQTMSKSLSSLKALQEVDFSQTSDQIKTMGNFYERMNVAMKELSASADATKEVRQNLASLNENLSAVNMIYRSVADSKNHVEKLTSSMAELGDSADQMTHLNKNLRSLNNVYGNVLSAMTGGKG